MDLIISHFHTRHCPDILQFSQQFFYLISVGMVYHSICFGTAMSFSVNAVPEMAQDCCLGL